MTRAYPPHTANPNLVTLQRTILGLATIPFLYQIYNVITMLLPENSATADAGTWILIILWILSPIIIWSTYLHIWRIERKTHHFNAAPKRAIWVVLFGLFLIGSNVDVLFEFAMDSGGGVPSSTIILSLFEICIEVLVAVLALVELSKLRAVKFILFVKEAGAVTRMEQGGVDGGHDVRIPKA